MKKAEVKGIVSKINVLKKRVAKDRDELRELLEELSAIEDSCDRAVQDLENAVDALSEYL